MLTANEARVIKNNHLLYQVLEKIEGSARNGESKVYFFTDKAGEKSERFFSGVIKLNEEIVNSLKDLGYNVEKVLPNYGYAFNELWEVSF